MLIEKSFLLQVRVERNRIARARETKFFLISLYFIYYLHEFTYDTHFNTCLKCVEYIMSYDVRHICILHDVQICPLHFTGVAYSMSCTWYIAYERVIQEVTILLFVSCVLFLVLLLHTRFNLRRLLGFFK